jgi:hypothetical protein
VSPTVLQHTTQTDSAIVAAHGCAITSWVVCGLTKGRRKILTTSEPELETKLTAATTGGRSASTTRSTANHARIPGTQPRRHHVLLVSTRCLRPVFTSIVHESASADRLQAKLKLPASDRIPGFSFTTSLIQILQEKVLAIDRSSMTFHTIFVSPWLVLLSPITSFCVVSTSIIRPKQVSSVHG